MDKRECALRVLQLLKGYSTHDALEVLLHVQFAVIQGDKLTQEAMEEIRKLTNTIPN